MDAKKVVVTVNLHDDNAKQKAMKVVSSIQGIDSLVVDMKAQKLTVIGNIDPVDVVCRLRKKFCARIDTVGPAKEPEKKKEDKKDGGEKKNGDNKKEGKDNKGKNKKDENEPKMEIIKTCRDFQSHIGAHYCVHVQDDPNPCSIL